MKIEQVILQNIGVYVNRNKFDFSTDKPIILIGGMNGRGKTTFLEAVLFALYGGRFLQNGQKLEQYLKKISNMSGESVECSIELHFVLQEQENTEYRVIRGWNRAKKSMRMTTEVYKNGAWDKVLSENWDMFVEEILPQAMASFFFFDGEKIAELASSENDEHMRSAIVSMLGIDIIEQLITDLHTVSEQCQKKIKNPKHEELQCLDEQMEELTAILKQKNCEIQEEEKSCDRVSKELSQLEDKYVTFGGDYETHRQRYEKDKNEIQAKLEINQGQMLEIAASNLPLLLVSPLLHNIDVNVFEEEEQRELNIFIKQFPRLYREYSEGKNWGSDTQSFFDAVSKKLSNKESVFDFDDDSREQLKDIWSVLDKEKRQIQQILEEKESLNFQLSTVEEYLAINVEDKKLSAVLEEIKSKSAEQGMYIQRIQNLKKECEELEAQIEILCKQRKQIVKALVEELEETDENKRLVLYAHKQINIMERYKERLQAYKIQNLAEQMTECFGQIIAKEGLIKEVSIDPVTLEFSYYNQYGRKVEKQTFSSGEKQILVIAMLWALGICSKVQFPVIIDTPLARLDSAHRTSLIENYFPKASEQVIVLSTDQEITKQDYQNLSRYVGKEYTLVYDEETMSSSVEEGYFWRRES